MNWPDQPELWNLLDRYEDRWRYTYPDLNITREIMRMAEWCEANPTKRPKKNWKRFATLWLARNQQAIERSVAREAWNHAYNTVQSEVGKFRG